MALLELDDVHTYYGNIAALKGISLKVEEGEIVTLIGSNGAGKSTTLRSVSGLTPPRQGSISFDGKEIAETAPQDIVRLGISQAPEGRHCFQRMTVRENLDLGAFLRREKDLTILLIEHDMKVVMGVSEHIWVLDHGEKIAEGEPEEIRTNDRVIEAYLGKQGG